MNVFLSLPITSNLDSSGVFLSGERSFYEALLSVLRDSGVHIRSAVLNEDWGRRKLSVVEFTQYDLEGIRASDTLLVVTRSRLTRDIMLELGLALGADKLAVLLIPRETWTTHMLDGLAEIGRVHICRFDSSSDNGQSVGKMALAALRSLEAA